MLGLIQPSEIRNLPPLPASVARLAELVSDMNSAIDDFAEVIEFDQVLTANTLRWANSAWSQTRTPIYNIRTAIIRLGAANILKLSIGYHLMSPMCQPNPGYELLENQLWQHSVAAALAAEKLHHFTAISIPSAAFAAALMHDIGKLVLGRHLGHDILRAKIRERMQKDDVSYVRAEKEIMGIDHAEVGAEIAREWKLPEVLEKSIAEHHVPDQRPDRVLDAVHVANAVAKLVGEGLGLEQMNMDVSGQAALRLGLNGQSIQTLCAVVKDTQAETENLWQMH